MIPKEVSNKARECNGFKWLTLIGLRIVRIHLWFDLRGRPKHSAVFLFYQGRHWPYLGAPLQHIATNALVTHQSLDHIVQHLQHRSHRQTSLLGRFTCQKQGCRNPPAPHRFPARLLSPKPTIHTTNGSHIHSHTFRSRILHTGTLYLLSPPTLAPIYLTAASSPPPSSLPPAACTCQPLAQKSASLPAARVFPGFFSTPRPTPLTGEPYNTANDITALASVTANTVLEGSFRSCLTATANYFFLSFFGFDRDGGHQVCAPGYRDVY